MKVKRHLSKIMKIEYNPMSILTAFIAAVIATLFGSGSSKAISQEPRNLFEQTIEGRVESIREQIERKDYPSRKPYRADCEKTEAWYVIRRGSGTGFENKDCSNGTRRQTRRNFPQRWNNWNDT